MITFDFTKLHSKPLALLGFSVMGVMLGGCTSAQWYEGFREGQAFQCEQLDGSARDECLERVNPESYEEYQRRRDSLK